jgi:hypothetical protein
MQAESWVLSKRLVNLRAANRSTSFLWAFQVWTAAKALPRESEPCPAVPCPSLRETFFGLLRPLGLGGAALALGAHVLCFGPCFLFLSSLDLLS